MTEHTKEPWAYLEEECIIHATDSPFIAQLIPYYHEPENFDENASRIVECVNALAGISNPSAVKDVIEAARAFVDGYESEAAFSKLNSALAKLEQS